MQKVLRQHIGALRQATLAILKSESLTGQELKSIMAQHPPQDPPHKQVCCESVVKPAAYKPALQHHAGVYG